MSCSNTRAHAFLPHHSPILAILSCRYDQPSKSQLVLVTPGDDLISLMTDSSDADHALCNSVYVGIVPTDAQYAALQLYSATFKVREERSI